jgi:hypothetical protein
MQHITPTNPLSALLVPDKSNEVSLSLITPFLGIRDMYRLSRVQNGPTGNIHDMFTKSPYGIRQWIDIAIRITTDPTRGFIPEVILEHLSAVPPNRIFTNIRQLVCPWTSVSERLPVTGMMYTIPRESRMFAISEQDTETRLVFQARDTESTVQASCPARNRVGFTSDIVINEPKITIPPSELDYFEEIQTKYMAINGKPFLMPDFTQRLAISHSAFPVHGGVFAVMEFFNGGYTRHAEGDNGVYYFDYSGRFLRHKKLFLGLDEDCCYIQSRPFNLWFLLNGAVEYTYGIGCCDNTCATRKRGYTYGFQCCEKGCSLATRTISHHKITLATPTDRIFPALWMAASGDATGAMDFLTHELERLPINTKSSLNERTLLHYAATEGKHETVRALLSNKASPHIRDFNGDTALMLACENFHHETVQVLIEQGNLEPRDILRSWTVFCQMGEISLLPPFPSTEVIHLQCRVKIPFITRALLSNMVKPSFDTLINGFKSTAIMASPDAVELILTTGGNQIRNYFNRWGAVRFLFGTFQTRDHMLESMGTLRLMFGKLEMDVNRSYVVENETPIVWAVRDGTVEAVRLLVEEFHADVRPNPITGTDIMMEATLRCVGPPNWRDAEGEKIRDYLADLLY